LPFLGTVILFCVSVQPDVKVPATNALTAAEKLASEKIEAKRNSK
jgi:hypothetical protein